MEKETNEMNGANTTNGANDVNGVNGANTTNTTNGVKAGKGFDKKWIAILIIVAVAVIGIVYLTMGNKGQKVDLTQTQLGKYLPELPASSGKITCDNEKYLDIDLDNVSQENYNSYIKKCEQNGYNIDVSSGSTFDAYNEESYRVYMYTSQNTKMHISLTAPTKLEKITWPTSSLALTIPTPNFDGGYINTDKSNEINITIGNLTKDDYDEYVNECSKKGYNVDYEKNTKSYKAKNNEGNILEVFYYGGRRVNIHLKGNTTNTNSLTPTETPKPIETPTIIEDPKTTEKETPKDTPSSSTGLSKEFKDAMDSYEDFINEYVEFMKKYKANSSDLSLLSQYSTIMQKYNEQVSSFEKWDSEDLSTEEAKYYIDVQARINKKILEIAE